MAVKLYANRLTYHNSAAATDLLRELDKLPPEQQRDAFRKRCRGDLFFLLVYGLGRRFADTDWFFARCREVQASPENHIDLWAREHGKSLVITVAKTIQDILIDPEITVGIFSHTRAMAKSFLRVIKREFETNVLLKGAFDDILWDNPQRDAAKWSEDDGLIVKRKGNPPESTVEACGLVEGMPTGRHYGLRVYDDILTAESASSPDQMQKVLDALDMSQNLGKIGGVARMIGTRYKQGDPYEVYIKRGQFKARIKPATDTGRVDGKPVYFTQEVWDSKVAGMSAAIIASQMLQNPMAADSVIFQPDWFNFWPSDKPLPSFEAIYQCFDGATSAKQTADYSCLLTFGIFKVETKFSCMIVDCFMEQWAYPDVRDEILRQMGNKFGATDRSVDGIIIEDKSSGSVMIPELRRAGINVIPFNPGKLDKIARANLVSPLVRDGRVWLPESRAPNRKGMPMSWLSMLWEQIQYFPQTKHDDGIDCLTSFLAVMNKTGFLVNKGLPVKESYWRRQMKGSPYG
jgi:predicted phage terminase large subunit-like protein